MYSSTVNNFNFLIQFAFYFWLTWSHLILFKSKLDQKIGWKIASSDRTFKESLLIADYKFKALSITFPETIQSSFCRLKGKDSSCDCEWMQWSLPDSQLSPLEFFKLMASSKPLWIVRNRFKMFIQHVYIPHLVALLVLSNYGFRDDRIILYPLPI